MLADASFMERAIALGQLSLPLAGVNPPVGAVLVRNARIIGEGFHRGPGSPHAEAAAIADAIDRGRLAKEAAEGVTLYCTLEPCCHFGPGKRRPPCAEAIIAAGIRRVVFACRDPNPLVAGGGAALLRGAGVQVEEGLLGDRAAELIKPFSISIRLKRPFIHVKWAQSLDGRLACRGGFSRWITNREARRYAHEMRARCDAVMIGAGTLRADDPCLTVRDVPSVMRPTAPAPLRVVLAGRKPLDMDSRLFSPALREGSLVLAATGSIALEQARRNALHVLEVSPDERGLPDLAESFRALYSAGVGSILVEGGSTVLTALLSRGLWDRMTVFVAPLLLGEGIDAVGDLGVLSPDRGIALAQSRFEAGEGFFRIDAERGAVDAPGSARDEEPSCSRG